MRGDTEAEVFTVTDAACQINTTSSAAVGEIVLVAGGPPTIADVDGDGAPVIGVAAATRYAVFETNGTVKWAAVIQDSSSNVTGSSVFDFDGTGRAVIPGPCAQQHQPRRERFTHTPRSADDTV